MRHETDPAIRPHRSGDLPALRELLAEASLPTVGIDALGDALIVAVAGERVVGCAGLERYGDVGLLRSVAVDPAWRGLGLGVRLTRTVLAAAEGDGIRRVYLLTETAPEFFRALGFRSIPRDEADMRVRVSAEFTELCPASAIMMVRDSDPD